MFGVGEGGGEGFVKSGMGMGFGGNVVMFGYVDKVCCCVKLNIVWGGEWVGLIIVVKIWCMLFGDVLSVLVFCLSGNLGWD